MATKYIHYQRGKVLVHYIITWAVLFALFILIRGLGVAQIGEIQTDFVDKIFLVLLFGFVVGTLSSLFQIIIEEYFYQRLSFLKLISLKIIIILTLSIIILLGTFLYFKATTNPNLTLGGFLLNPNALAIIIFILGADTLVSFIRKVSQMLGEKTFQSLVKGKYLQPKKEERIFMFLDLKGSTTIAEKLGFETYSRFIQDCFNDLSVIMQYKAEIYQYVGDEAVLTWKVKEGLAKQNCLQAFFKFKDQLSKRESYYMGVYNTLPIFKAGAHLGPVMVAEVGKFKKEIAYHGDTINTAARIQSNCNKFNSDFIISKQLKEVIDKTGIRYLPLETLQLRGKQASTTLYAIDDKKLVFVN